VIAIQVKGSLRGGTPLGGAFLALLMARRAGDQDGEFRSARRQ
jgi:hypothetical protein